MTRTRQSLRWQAQARRIAEELGDRWCWRPEMPP